MHAFAGIPPYTRDSSAHSDRTTIRRPYSLTQVFKKIFFKVFDDCRQAIWIYPSLALALDLLFLNSWMPIDFKEHSRIYLAKAKHMGARHWQLSWWRIGQVFTISFQVIRSRHLAVATPLLFASNLVAAMHAVDEGGNLAARSVADYRKIISHSTRAWHFRNVSMLVTYLDHIEHFERTLVLSNCLAFLPL